MSAARSPGSPAQDSQAVTPVLRLLWAQTRSELVARWRVAAFSVTSLVFPAVLFTFFGLPFAKGIRPDGGSLGAYLLASFGAYAVGQVMVFGFGIGVANERAQKIDLLMRATPLPPLVHLVAKVAIALLFALASLAVLFAYGALVGGVRMDTATWASMVIRLLVGSVPLIGLGFAIGYASGPHAAPGVANLVYLPLSFASGLFLPLSQLPEFVQRLAPYLPTYHYAQLAWGALGAQSEPIGVSILWLVGYSVLFLGLAARAYQREASRKFG